jgi:thymidylate kinase
MNEIVITIAGKLRTGKSELVRSIHQHLEELGITAHVHTTEVPNQIALLKNGAMDIDDLRTTTKVVLKTEQLARISDRTEEN